MKHSIIALVALVLSACATVPQYQLVVVPGAGKTVAQAERDARLCWNANRTDDEVDFCVEALGHKLERRLVSQ